MKKMSVFQQMSHLAQKLIKPNARTPEPAAMIKKQTPKRETLTNLFNCTFDVTQLHVRQHQMQYYHFLIIPQTFLTVHLVY